MCYYVDAFPFSTDLVVGGRLYDMVLVFLFFGFDFMFGTFFIPFVFLEYFFSPTLIGRRTHRHQGVPIFALTTFCSFLADHLPSFTV